MSDPRPALATDTGLLDRALFVDRVADEWRRSERTTDPMALIVAGIDGPDAAQGVSALANTFARCLRGIDILGRSDERHVAALLLNTHVTGVMSAVTRMRAELRRLAGDGALAQTTSIGASFHPSREVAEPADLLKLAERAIARAREEGPGRICFWQHAGYLFDPPETP